MQIPLESATEASILEALSSFTIHEWVNASRNIEALRQEKENCQSRLAIITKRSDARYARIDELTEKREKVATEHSRLGDVLSKQKSVTDRIQSKQAAINQQFHNLNTRITNLNRIVSWAEEESAQEHMKSRALVLKSLAEEKLDTSIPITVTKQVVSFRTNYLKIRDGFGGYIPFCFGKFDVTVRKGIRGGTAYLHVYCSPVGGGEKRSGYPHPHLESNGRACLGNAERMLLNDMANKDIVSVVITIIEFLETYNQQSPYTPLSDWVGANKFDSPSHVCTDCDPQHMQEDCPLNRCGHCNRSDVNRPGFVDRTLRLCTNCLVEHFDYYPGARKHPSPALRNFFESHAWTGNYIGRSYRSQINKIIKDHKSSLEQNSEEAP